MTPQQKAVITGFTKQGATIEEICLYMQIDGMEVQKVVEKVEVLKIEKKILSTPLKKRHWSFELQN